MFTIQRQNNCDLFTVICHYREERTNLNQFLYHYRNLTVSDAAQFVLSKKTEPTGEFTLEDTDSAEDIKTVFRLTNVPKVFITDEGRLSAVQP